MGRYSTSDSYFGQGLGKEYLDGNGVWHPQKDLKPGPNQNIDAAKDTHIQL